MLDDLIKKILPLTAIFVTGNYLNCAHVKIKPEDENNYASRVKKKFRVEKANKALGRPDDNFARIYPADWYWIGEESFYRKRGYLILKMEKPIVDGEGPDLKVYTSEYGSYEIEVKGFHDVGEPNPYVDGVWIHVAYGRGSMEIETRLDLVEEIKITSIGEMDVLVYGVEEI